MLYQLKWLPDYARHIGSCTPQLPPGRAQWTLLAPDPYARTRFAEQASGTGTDIASLILDPAEMQGFDDVSDFHM